MTRWLVRRGSAFLVFGFVAFCGYMSERDPKGRAFRAYQEFAKALLEENWSRAESLASTGSVVEFIAWKRAQPRPGFYAAVDLQGDVHGELHLEYRLVSAEKSADGTRYHLRAEEMTGGDTLQRLADNGYTTRYRHEVDMVRVGDEWRVESFSEEMDDLTAKH